tara:strand:- start:249 stop:1340 length:1092 start_codon:yes stop_codon:yes gene_type:complete
MSQSEKKNFIFYIIFLLFFLILSNKFYTYEQTLLISQLDGYNYMGIANSLMDFDGDKIPYHHAQRFFIPFIIGLIGNLTEINNYTIFRIFVSFAAILIVFLHILLTFESKCNLKTGIMCFSIVFLNPYLFRYFISVPTMVNDIFFLLGLYIFCLGLFKKEIFIFLGVLISIISRQTGLFVFLGAIFYFYKKKMFKSIFVISIIFFGILMIANFYAKNNSSAGFTYEHLWGIFNSIFINREYVELIKWLMLPFYSFLPIILYLFTRKEIIPNNINKEKFILIFIIISTIGISLLAGPELATRNIIRQTTIILPILVIYLMFFSRPKKKLKSFLNYELLMVLIFYISSLHPVYSKIEILKLVKLF